MREFATQRIDPIAARSWLLGRESNEAPSEEIYWLVDPIDGTTNYANGIPYYCVSVALCQGVDPILGIVVEGATGRVFHGRRGNGAFMRDLNGRERAMHVNQNKTLRTSILATGFPYHKAELPDNNLAEYNHFLPNCLALHGMGAAALDLAYVAAGSNTAFWEGWLNPWDIAAGALLVREAGGCVVDYNGDEWRVEASAKRGLLAMNGEPEFHNAMLGGIEAARATLTERALEV